ncbi:MAG: threonine/serine dehydratase [Gemmatimonadota bacterium]|nr:MAG: threonine/serine dehydratase [Gemmatimonadota bacterium]
MTHESHLSLSDYDIAAAQRAVTQIAIPTPVVRSAPLTKSLGRTVVLKLENLQVTGSFKVRGAANRLLHLTEAERRTGIVTCSSGNHGRAVSYVAELLGIPATVCVPKWVDPVKLAAIRQHGAEAVLHGMTYDDAEQRSLEIAWERNVNYIHPFDDPRIIAGQGTIGRELLEQFPPIDCVVVPLSGGGLIAGIAIALKSHNPEIAVIGVSALNASVMVQSLRAGKPITVPEQETIANALAGGIDLNNKHTFRLVRDLVDEHILVSEDEIRSAMVFAAEEHKLVVEGGGAVGIAALLGRHCSQLGENVALVISGGNVGLDTLVRLRTSTQNATP